MHTSTLLFALLPTLVHSFWPLERRDGFFCLTQQQAHTVASNYAKLFTAYSKEYADSVLAPDWSDQTDSVTWLVNNGTNCPQPFGAVTFPTLASFEASSASQPLIPFEVLNVWVACTNVVIRWISKQTPEHVQGIAVLSTTPKLGYLSTEFLINHVYSEFNSGAWGVNVGICPIDASSTCSA